MNRVNKLSRTKYGREETENDKIKYNEIDLERDEIQTNLTKLPLNMHFSMNTQFVYIAAIYHWFNV